MTMPRLSSVSGLVALGFTAAAVGVHATEVRVRVDARAPGIAVAPTMHGLFFEDINHAADGGLYGELIENRSFEHANRLHAWREIRRGAARGQLAIHGGDGLHANNPNYLRLLVELPGEGYGVANHGFDAGIPVREGAVYRFSVHARSANPGTSVTLEVVLEGEDGRRLAGTKIEQIGDAWRKREVELRAAAADPKARLVVLLHETGAADLDMVSLFPAETFKGRRNGMRPDLAQALADMKPGFLRFPGGCIVEGHGLANAYRWKDTVGDVAERRQNWNLWRDERSPEYHQTYGLGFFEYFQLAEDLGAEALPVVNCGMACQARRGVHCAMDELGVWVQDALDLIEFANGPATSRWGAVRAAMGRAEPFGMKYLAVGNEQWNQEYFDRYVVFHRAIRERHPEIKIVSTSGPFVDDDLWRFAWDRFKAGVPADLVDEHYYVPPSWLLANSDRYARYDRAGPKVFVGEFAAHEAGRRSTHRAALAEAAYMTGLLRNADVVEMAAYAPLLAKRGRAQWEPNLIWFDSTRVLRTASYHVQALFGQNRPDRVFPTSVEPAGAPPPAPTAGGRIGLGTWNTGAEFRDVEVIAADGRVLFRDDFAGGASAWELLRGKWETRDGVLRQTDDASADRAAFAGDEGWRDYTLRLKARKFSGREGFLVHFGAGEAGMARWNIGGWENQRHALDIPGLPRAEAPGRIETGRWYELRLELRGPRIRAWIDDQLVHEASLADLKREPLYVAAGRDERAGEWVFFLVNPSAVEITARVETGAAGVLPEGVSAAEWTLLASDDAGAVNTFEEPGRVAPRTEAVALEVKDGAFARTLPASSFGVLRVKTGR